MVKKVEVDAIWLQQMVNTLEEALDSESFDDQIKYTETVLNQMKQKKPPIADIELPE